MEEMERKKDGKSSELMDLLIARDWKSLFNIKDVKIGGDGRGRRPLPG
jgi:hypothetical protein